MKNYHMQIKYSIEGWVYDFGSEHYMRKDLIEWTNIEDAPSFEEMCNERSYNKNDQVIMQHIRMFADDGEYFLIGHNVVNNYPHRINHLHKANF